MKSRVLFGMLLFAGIVAAGGRPANASIVLSFNGDGEARLVSLESALADAIRLNIQGGKGLFATLVGDQVAADGSRSPVLQVGPVNASTADAAIASEAYLTFSFQTGENSELGLRTLEFDMSSEAAEFGCRVQSSLDGFGTGRPKLDANRTLSERFGKIHYSVDLSAERFRDLSEVDFRIYFYSSKSDEPLEFDGIRLNREVIVAPEPGSSMVWLLMLATVLFMAAAGWTARRNRLTWSYATTGGGRSSTMMTREPWSNRARENILDIINRGRIG